MGEDNEEHAIDGQLPGHPPQGRCNTEDSLESTAGGASRDGVPTSKEPIDALRPIVSTACIDSIIKATKSHMAAARQETDRFLFDFAIGYIATARAVRESLVLQYQVRLETLEPRACYYVGEILAHDSKLRDLLDFSSMEMTTVTGMHMGIHVSCVTSRPALSDGTWRTCMCPLAWPQVPFPVVIPVLLPSLAVLRLTKEVKA